MSRTGLLFLALTLGAAPALADDVVFYEGNNCTQGTVFSYDSRRDWDENCKRAGRCKGDNDEARSVRLQAGIGRPLRISVFDSPAALRNDDFTIIEVRRPDLITPNGLCVGTFERAGSIDDRGSFRIGPNPPAPPVVTIYFSGQARGLDGKISHVRIEALPR